ncbi:MAG: ABC transporter transmembrane domain-containing protein, partial [Candidatus Omnitrophica bacterium]|nr:ABC transporter transmembrane domain-containing protein [Candidatus Omnitrophota bacterium]
MEAVGVVSLVMVADLFLNPSLNNISLITQHAIVFLKAFGIPSTFTWFLAIFLFFSVLKTILQIFSQYLILKTKYVVLRDISVGTFEDFFAAKWYFFSSEKQGTLLNTFNREVSMVGDAFGAMARYFSSVLQIALFLIVPFYISWQVTLLTMIIALFFSIPFVLLGKISYRLGVLNIATGNEIG